MLHAQICCGAPEIFISVIGLFNSRISVLVYFKTRISLYWYSAFGETLGITLIPSPLDFVPVL
jgi:hypothetical protein